MPLLALKQLEKSSAKILSQVRLQKLYKTCVEEAVSISGSTYGSMFLERDGHLVRVFSTVPKRRRMTPRMGGNTYQSFYQDKIKFIKKNQSKRITRRQPRI